MDPISALGIASAIITFIEFSWSLVSGTIEVHRNGGVNDDQDIGTIVSELTSITEDLRKRGPGLTRAEKSIVDLSEQCLATSQEIQKLLQPLMVKFRTKMTIWKSVKAQWTIMMGKEKIDELTSKLRGYREQLMLNLSLLLREDQSRLNIQMRSIQDSFSDLNLNVSTEFTSLRKSLEVAVTKRINPQMSHTLNSDDTVSFNVSLEEIKDMVALLQSSMVDMPRQERILRQLAYAQMTSRRLGIRDPEAGTLRWIFGHESPPEEHDNPTGQEDRLEEYDNSADQEGSIDERDNPSPGTCDDPTCHGCHKVRIDASHQFLKWLQDGTGVFHISGNTGSGKSSLMKYVAEHQLTRRKLELWAGLNTIVLADFYFWAPGNELQRSLEGMRRSLLFGALSQHPELMEKVFPRQWRLMKVSSFSPDSLVEGLREFGQRQIDDAFAMLIEGTNLLDYNFCFFIDGLDELDGDKQDHENLAEQICGWAKAGRVKFCVSSRPYPEFKDIFLSYGHTTIYLHQLNRPDIYAYCREKFDQDRKGKLLPKQDCQELIQAITEKSQGVFLWTFLVVRQLLSALRNEDPLHVLKQRLDEVPQQLEEVYAKSLESVSRSKIDRTRAYRVLLLALENPLPCSLYALAFSWIPDFEFFESQGIQDAEFLEGVSPSSYSDTEIQRRLKRVTAQIRGLTRDFLEVSSNFGSKGESDIVTVFMRALPRLEVVNFFHRSARDYLLENKLQRTSLHDSWPEFAAENVYFKILLAEINLVPHRTSEVACNLRLGYFLVSLYNRNNGVEIIRGLQTSANRRGVSKPFWAHLHTITETVEKQVLVYDLSSGSLVHVAAYNGLKRFVLDEVDLNPALLRSDNDLSVLVSAALYTRNSGECSLLRELLTRHSDLDGTHPVRHNLETGLIERWPVWVIVSVALIELLMRQFKALYKIDDVLVAPAKACDEFTALEDIRDLVHDFVRVNQYIIDKGWNLAMAFEIEQEATSESRFRPSIESRPIGFGEIIRYCETLEPGLDSESSQDRWRNFLLGTTNCYGDKTKGKYKIERFIWGGQE